eukprot:jgi/Botrbrau1/2440/Bobra.0395s0061.1
MSSRNGRSSVYDGVLKPLRQSSLFRFLVLGQEGQSQNTDLTGPQRSQQGESGGESSPASTNDVISCGTPDKFETSVSSPRKRRKIASLTQCFFSNQIERQPICKELYKQRLLRSYHQVFYENLHQVVEPWDRLRPQGYVSSVEMDQCGELIVSTAGAVIYVHGYADLVAHCQSCPTGLRRGDDLCPKLTLKAEVHTVAWDPRDQNWIAASGSDLMLYDLEYTQGSPTRKMPLDDKERVSSFTFMAGGPFHIAVATIQGKVHLWDTRTCRPSGMLSFGGERWAISGLQASRDSQIVIGARKDQMMIWDMRGGTQGSLTLGRHGPSHRSLLDIIDLGHLVSTRQTDALRSCYGDLCNPQCLRLNPVDQNLIAFGLCGGKAGVLDICRQKLLHLVCGAEVPYGGSIYMYPYCPIAWSPCGDILFLGRHTNEIVATNISLCSEPSSLTRLGSEGDQDQALHPETYTAIATENEPTCLDVHPDTLDIVAAGGGCSTMIFSCERQDEST